MMYTTKIKESDVGPFYGGQWRFSTAETGCFLTRKKWMGRLIHGPVRVRGVAPENRGHYPAAPSCLKARKTPHPDRVRRRELRFR